MALVDTEKDDRLGALRVSMDEARAARDQGFWVTLGYSDEREAMGKPSEITGCINSHEHLRLVIEHIQHYSWLVYTAVFESAIRNGDICTSWLLLAIHPRLAWSLIVSSFPY